MSIFNWKKKKEQNLENQKESFQNEELFQKSPYYADNTNEKRVIDLCEQMIDKAKEISGLKEQYNTTNACLNDLILLNEMPKEQQKSMKDIAANIVQLEQARNTLSHAQKKITDAHFNQFEAEQNEIPKAIKRLDENEKYLAAVERDMNFLENEKLRWKIYNEDLVKEQGDIKRISIFGFGVVTIIFMLLLVLQSFFDIDTKIYWIAIIFCAAMVGFYAEMKLQSNKEEKQKTNTNQNQAIALLNKTKIKYVNIKNAVDYSREKYHVKNAREFQDTWTKYLEEVKQREKIDTIHDDMEYFENKLKMALRENRFFQGNFWMENPRALFDNEAMDTQKKDLVNKKDTIYSRIEFLSKSLKRQREDIQKLLEQNTRIAEKEEVVKILETIDKISGFSIG